MPNVDRAERQSMAESQRTSRAGDTLTYRPAEERFRIGGDYRARNRRCSARILCSNKRRAVVQPYAESHRILRTYRECITSKCHGLVCVIDSAPCGLYSLQSYLELRVEDALDHGRREDGRHQFHRSK